MSEQSGEQSGGVEGQATTTFTKDYLGRDLITPLIDSRDYLGRRTLSTIDYLNRHLQP